MARRDLKPAVLTQGFWVGYTYEGTVPPSAPVDVSPFWPAGTPIQVRVSGAGRNTRWTVYLPLNVFYSDKGVPCITTINRSRFEYVKQPQARS